MVHNIQSGSTNVRIVDARSVCNFQNFRCSGFVRCSNSSDGSLEMSCSACSMFGLFSQNELFGLFGVQTVGVLSGFVNFSKIFLRTEHSEQPEESNTFCGP